MNRMTYASGADVSLPLDLDERRYPRRSSDLHSFGFQLRFQSKQLQTYE
jgi:hypothetical protein